MRRPLPPSPPASRRPAEPCLADGDDLGGPLAVRSFEAGKLTTLGQSTIEAMARRGQIPCVRIGTGQKHRAVVFPVSALRQWLHERAMENLGKPADGGDEKYEPADLAGQEHDAQS